MCKSIVRTDAALPTSKEDGWTKEEELSKDIFIQLCSALYANHGMLTNGQAAKLAIKAKQCSHEFFETFTNKYSHE